MPVYVRSPQFRNLVNAHGYRHIEAPVVGLGEELSATEEMARLEREIAIADAAASIREATALSPEEIKSIQKKEEATLRKMQSDAKDAMINSIATQLAFEVAVNAIPGVGQVLSVVLGQVTKKTGERYKKKSEEYVKMKQKEIDAYKQKRLLLVANTLGRVYDQEYKTAEQTAIQLVTDKAMSAELAGLGGFGSFIRKAVSSLVKTIKDPTRLVTKPIEQIKGFIDDLTGKSSYEATVKAADDQQKKANAEILTTTNAQIAEAQSPHGRSLMRTSIVNMLVQSPQFKRLAELILDTRRARLEAAKKASLGKKLAIGAGVVAAAVVATKVL